MPDDFALRPPEGATLRIADLVEAIRSKPTVLRLQAARHSLRRKSQPPEDVYIICSSPEQARRVRDWVAVGNTLDRYIGSVAFLEVTEDYISVYQSAPPEVVGQIAALLLPLLREQLWQVFTEMGEETAAYAREPGRLFL